MAAGALALALGCGDDGGAAATDAEASTAAASGSGSGSGTADETGDPNDPCGNGVQDGFEACDDGNRVNGDGCNNDCTPSGQIRWAVSFDGMAGVDCAEGVTTDSQGSVIAAGFVTTATAGEDLWLRKYDADGNALWTHEYNDANVNGNDTAQGVVVDANGDIYLAANSEVGPNAFEGLVRKLDADGNELWTQTVPLVFFTHAALDPDGNLVLVGLDDDNPDNGNMWAGKYDPDFAPIATTTFDGPSGAFDQALGVAVDGQGDVYMTGFVTVVGEQSNVWIGRYEDDLGLRLWSDSYGNTDSNLADDGRHVAVNADGSRVAVVGFESVIGDDTNIWVRVYQNNPAP